MYTDDTFNGRSTTPLCVYKRNGEVIEFDTPFRNLAEVVAVLRRELSTNGFAKSLIKACERVGGPNPKMAAWAHKLATDAITPKVAPTHSDINLLPIVHMLHRAQGAQKRMPTVVLHDTDGNRVMLKLAGDTSKRPGTVNVTDGRPYGDNTWYGRIATDGVFEHSRHVVAPVSNMLLALSDDPTRVAHQHGVATGTCCFCNRDLSTKESRSVGYGPQCADRFGLPWGKVSDEVKAADAAAREPKL